MRTKQALTIMMVVGLALGYKASAAGEFYERESTNEWFKVIAKDANLDDQTHWQKPTNEESSAEVDGDVIKLDTDLDDPLTYTAGNSTADVMVVNARFTATANKVKPSLVGDAPQAAVTVVANEDGTNWWGLVGNDGWVKFVNETPEIGNEYDVRVEFDLRAGQKKIRYSVEGKVLKAGDDDGWYANPQVASSFISSVAFAGTGDVGDFAGSNIVWRAAPVEIDEATQAGDGFDYTNGTLNVAVTVREAATATLKVIDFATGLVKQYDLDVAVGTTQIGWDISTVVEDSLVPGATYGYEVSMTAGGETMTKTGTFVSAATTPDDWFHADATSGAEDVAGGEWADTTDFPKPDVVDNAYAIASAAKFNVTNRSKGTNDLVVVDAHIVFGGFVDGDSLTPEGDTVSGFVAATKNGVPVWMALVTDNSEKKWVALEGAPAPEVSVNYVVRTEISFLEGHKQVSYLVKKADEEGNFVALSLNGNTWLGLADDTKDALESVALMAPSKLAKLTASITDRALAQVDGAKYYSMADAMAAGGDITLLTNVTVKPTGTGTWKFTNKGDYKVFVDLSGAPEGAIYTWKDGTLTVSVAQGVTYLIW